MNILPPVDLVSSEKSEYVSIKSWGLGTKIVWISQRAALAAEKLELRYLSQVSLSADFLPATASSKGPRRGAYFSTHSENCLKEPMKDRSCLTVEGSGALERGAIVCSVGRQPSSDFCQPNNTTFLGHMTAFFGLKVKPHCRALRRTSMKVSFRVSRSSAKIYRPSAILVILSA